MKAIFIDIDNTLLDFDEYVRTTMAEGFAHFGLPAYRPEMYHTFTTENNKLWRRIEEGTLTFEELQKIRWSRILTLSASSLTAPPSSITSAPPSTKAPFPSPVPSRCCKASPGTASFAPPATAPMNSSCTGWSWAG